MLGGVFMLLLSRACEVLVRSTRLMYSCTVSLGGRCDLQSSFIGGINGVHGVVHGMALVVFLCITSNGWEENWTLHTLIWPY